MTLTAELIRTIGYLIGLGAMWVFSDGIYSIALYINTPSFREGEKQSWKKDHAIRIVRCLISLCFMFTGFVLVTGNIG